MSLAERVHEILPRVREVAQLADEVAQGNEEMSSLPKARAFCQWMFKKLAEVDDEIREQIGDLDEFAKTVESISDEERAYLGNKIVPLINKTFELSDRIYRLQPVIRALCNQDEGALPTPAIADVNEIISLCLHIESVSPVYRVRDLPNDRTNAEGVQQPQFMHAIGQLLLEVLPRTTTPELLTVAGDWIKLVEAKFLPVLTGRLQGEDFSLAELVSDLATHLCVEQKCKSPEVLLALTRIATQLPDPATLLARVEPRLLFALENSPSVDDATFVSCVGRIARRLLNGDEHKEEWPRFARLLLNQNSEAALFVFSISISTIGMPSEEEIPHPDTWHLEEREEQMQLGRKLAAAFWLSHLFRRMGDEGREFFFSYIYWNFQPLGVPPGIWKKVGIDFGWTPPEEEKHRTRYEKELLPRFETLIPWPLTPVIPRVEFTPGQIASLAEAAAAKTISTLVSGGSLSEIVSADVVPHLRQEVGEEIWTKLPQDAQNTLTAASFIWKVQPARFDCSGAVVMDWKALEIALDAYVFREVWDGLGATERSPYEERGPITIGRKLDHLANVIDGKSGPLERALRDALQKKCSAILEERRFRSTIYEHRDIRNRATHVEPVSRAEFERSRHFVFQLLRSLYRKTTSQDGRRT